MYSECTKCLVVGPVVYGLVKESDKGKETYFGLTGDPFKTMCLLFGRHINLSCMVSARLNSSRISASHGGNISDVKAAVSGSQNVISSFTGLASPSQGG